MTIIDKYLELQEKYSNEYGEDTLLLMQVGHFFECYAIDNEIEKQNTYAFYKSADIMNIQVTKKNKSIVENSRKNPLMTGVNLCSKDKYIQILLDNNFTIVVMEQVTDPPNPKREVTQIISPGTIIDYSNKNSTNNFMCMYIEVDKTKKFKDIGLSVIDFTTGKNTIYEVYSNRITNDYYYSLDETIRFIQVYEPCEVLIIVNDSSHNTQTIKSISKSFIVNYLGLNNIRTHFKSNEEVNNDYKKISVQNSFFEKIFKNENKTMLSCIELLNLERMPLATLSYIHLLNFAYCHNETIIQKIKKPEIPDSHSHMILNNTSIAQLNITPPSNQRINSRNCLLGIINNTSTSIGRRYLRDQLLNPIFDVETLQKRYEYIDSLKENYLPIENILKKIIDIERLQRRVSLGIIQPCDFYSLDVSYNSINEIQETCKDYFHSDLALSDECYATFLEYSNEYKNMYKMDILAKVNLENINLSIYKSGIHDEIDKLEDTRLELWKKLNSLCKKFSKICGNDIDVIFKIEQNERDGFYIYGSPSRASNFEKKLKNYSGKNVHINTLGCDFLLPSNDIIFKKQASNKTVISSPLIKKMCKDYCSVIYNINKACSSQFKSDMAYFFEKYNILMEKLVSFVGDLDMYKSAAKTAIKNAYNKPVIVDNGNSQSFIKAKRLRHPIIEMLNQNTTYVPNDIEIGNTTEQNGMLLYGTNASGKSSLMKAVGLNVIMAQAGFFVASEEFHFYPYKKLFTRILNADNIFRGESSFAVEMGELRGILKRSDDRSIVLGDELCSGTEHISAQSIFASSVIHLDNLKTSFIFATHLHGLVKMDEIKSLEYVQAYHLSVEYNKQTETLYYDRILKKGNGNTIYGLEVCKAMDLDETFISRADEIRRKMLNLQDSVLDTRTSRYNSNVIVDTCEICSEKAEDTHHIQFQCTADENNIIGKQYHKNIASNLVPLCKKCHLNVHQNKIEIKGYIETSNGIKLDYNEIKESDKIQKDKSRKKFDENTVNKIINIYESGEFSKKTDKFFLSFLLNEHKIKISPSIFKKIKNKTY